MALPRLGAGWQSRIDRVLREVPAACGRSLEVEPRTHELLARWFDLVVTWSERTSLIAARNADTVVDLLLADAVAIASTGPEGSFIDVGSGVGAPALPLGLLRPALALTLVEPRDKRAAFLRTSIGTVGRPDVSLLRAYSSAAKDGCVDFALSRATLPPPEWLKEGARLARTGVWVLLAQDEAPKHSGWEPDIDLHYVWPFSGAPRRALRFVRVPAVTEEPAGVR